jgi:choline-glycine betaine transporter
MSASTQFLQDTVPCTRVATTIQTLVYMLDFFETDQRNSDPPQLAKMFASVAVSMVGVPFLHMGFHFCALLEVAVLSLVLFIFFLYL